MGLKIDRKRLDNIFDKVTDKIISDIGDEGFWKGHLSSSALATAVAIYAIYLYDEQKYCKLIKGGAAWLQKNQNEDGGWGDSPKSLSNISATLLCISVLTKILSGPNNNTLKRGFNYLESEADGMSPDSIIEAVNSKYSDDQTFSCPILSVCALSGLLGEQGGAFEKIKPLPFELAVLPRSFFKIIKMPVVSYALPALIAMGQLHYYKKKPKNPVIAFIRAVSNKKSLKVLKSIQPENGGFLEAIPLTGFVAISLSSTGRKDHAVTKKCIEFIEQSVRSDYSWPVDTNLANWVTCLCVNSLMSVNKLKDKLGSQQLKKLYHHLISQQFRQEHIYTGSRPGGWAWTNLPGAVPDADDTSAAMLSIANLYSQLENNIAHSNELKVCLREGMDWLMKIQNIDGGIPTFCSGISHLDFDRSAADITAHAINAVSKCRRFCDQKQVAKIGIFISGCWRFLEKQQSLDALWEPLWFGNEYMPDKSNTIFGTARIVSYLCDSDVYIDGHEEMMSKAVNGLVNAQSEDKGWGRKDKNNSSIEETAAVIDGLASFLIRKKTQGEININEADNVIERALETGTSRLLQMLTAESASDIEPVPIGLYFAKLWYSEVMYPLVFSVSALGKVKKLIDHDNSF
jgi:squalene-hopene/tetraprenyl-beta-curcumene cyclase